MTPAEITQAKIDVDTALQGKNANVGVAFGEDVFKAFVAAGHITKEKFGIQGTTLMMDSYPAYGKTHFAIFDWELGGMKFKVGGS
ncbi:MAG: hypothetical protein EPN26_15175 [Rhodospirillales bacterium]|nr:MAG: hypothetical protein EPN26_15175 [Rhodospirillales bacterium]